MPYTSEQLKEYDDWLANPNVKTFEAMIDKGLNMKTVQELYHYMGVMTNMNLTIPGKFNIFMKEVPANKLQLLAQRLLKVKAATGINVKFR